MQRWQSYSLFQASSVAYPTFKSSVSQTLLCLLYNEYFTFLSAMILINLVWDWEWELEFLSYILVIRVGLVRIPWEPSQKTNRSVLRCPWIFRICYSLTTNGDPQLRRDLVISALGLRIFASDYCYFLCNILKPLCSVWYRQGEREC